MKLQVSYYNKINSVSIKEYRLKKIQNAINKTENHSIISDFARAWINHYAGFTSINMNLRKHRSNRKRRFNRRKDFSERFLNQALDEIIAYNNQIVYRMDTPDDIDFDLLKLWYRKRIGKIICFPNFLSTSKYRWSNNDRIFKIQTNNSSSGKDITGVLDKGKAEYEKEVLFKSRSKFKIIGVKDEYIELQEVSRRTRPFIMIYCDTYTQDLDIKEKLGWDETEEECEESFLEKYG